MVVWDSEDEGVSRMDMSPREKNGQTTINQASSYLWVNLHAWSENPTLRGMIPYGFTKLRALRDFDMVV